MKKLLIRIGFYFAQLVIFVLLLNSGMYLLGVVEAATLWEFFKQGMGVCFIGLGFYMYNLFDRISIKLNNENII